MQLPKSLTSLTTRRAIAYTAVGAVAIGTANNQFDTRTHSAPSPTTLQSPDATLPQTQPVLAQPQSDLSQITGSARDDLAVKGSGLWTSQESTGTMPSLLVTSAGTQTPEVTPNKIDYSEIYSSPKISRSEKIAPWHKEIAALLGISLLALIGIISRSRKKAFKNGQDFEENLNKLFQTLQENAELLLDKVKNRNFSEIELSSLEILANEMTALRDALVALESSSLFKGKKVAALDQELLESSVLLAFVTNTLDTIKIFTALSEGLTENNFTDFMQSVVNVIKTHQEATEVKNQDLYFSEDYKEYSETIANTATFITENISNILLTFVKNTSSSPIKKQLNALNEINTFIASGVLNLLLAKLPEDKAKEIQTALDTVWLELLKKAESLVQSITLATDTEFTATGDKGADAKRRYDVIKPYIPTLNTFLLQLSATAIPIEKITMEMIALSVLRLPPSEIIILSESDILDKLIHIAIDSEDEKMLKALQLIKLTLEKINIPLLTIGPDAEIHAIQIAEDTYRTFFGKDMKIESSRTKDSDLEELDTSAVAPIDEEIEDEPTVPDTDLSSTRTSSTARTEVPGEDEGPAKVKIPEVDLDDIDFDVD